MLTEFEVRRELEIIQNSDATPRAKARKLLRLGKSLRTQAQALVEAQSRTKRSLNINADRQLERMAASSRQLREEVRTTALGFLRSNSAYLWSVGLS